MASAKLTRPVGSRARKRKCDSGREETISDEHGWRPAKSLDIESRKAKARKIIGLLSSWRELQGARILDIGTGAGVIAGELANAAGPSGSVMAVDVEDLRVLKDGFAFRLIEGNHLPFPDGAFDVVISNVVIEHVGDRDDQLDHLREIRRVLSDGGCAYLALPNRWAPVEPHFGVPLLTWLPRKWRTPYLRRTRRAEVYDCNPLSWREANRLFRDAGLHATEQTYEAMKLIPELEQPWLGTRMILRAPSFVLKAIHPVIPTFIFRAEPARAGREGPLPTSLPPQSRRMASAEDRDASDRQS